ncbi:MAG: radical SAM family heme chaperone HemW [Chloroflexi bacterium]|nr:radical SAM family heme chaperone HemW [Chloroflexota bacterium]
MSDTLALYIHIPFCETRCPYCDFNTYAGIEDLIPQYVDALAEELRLWGEALAQPDVATVFFGGGTPSYLHPKHIQHLMETARASFLLMPGAEVTLESNPGDITPDRVQSWRSAGINRVSTGVQSLDDALLQLLGRRHTAAEAVQAYRCARAEGFDNINLDLMFGLPGQTLAQWQDTLSRVLELRPEHLSMYCLTLEEGTPLWAWVRSGKVQEPDGDLAADMYLLAQEMAASAGYQHYEISNWALPGREARHNLAYWRSRQYLGVGPGAHSYLDGWRFAVVKSPRAYIRRIAACANLSCGEWMPETLRKRGLLESADAVNAQTLMGEHMMMGLRLAEGVSDAAFRARFGVGQAEQYSLQIRELSEIGLLQWEDGCLKLTSQGKLLGNEVFQRFVA